MEQRTDSQNQSGGWLKELVKRPIQTLSFAILSIATPLLVLDHINLTHKLAEEVTKTTGLEKDKATYAQGLRTYDTHLKKMSRLAVPCTVERTLEIDQARAWINLHMEDISREVELKCDTRTNCPEQIDWAKLLTTTQKAHIFCPTQEDQELVTLKDSSGKETVYKVGGTIVFEQTDTYPGAFSITDRKSQTLCTDVESMIHESAHLSLPDEASSHKTAQDGMVDDTVYLIGKTSEDICDAGNKPL